MAGNGEDLVELIKLAGGPAAVVALGWWLKGKFVEVVDGAKAQLATHEKQDERRHRQNLVRFTKIAGKLGIEDVVEDYNGHGDE